MPLVSHSKAIRLYKIGRGTLRSLAAAGKLTEQLVTGPNGEAIRLIQTEDLDRLGYERKALRGTGDRPFIEERLDNIECDLGTTTDHDTEMLRRLEVIQNSLDELLRLADKSPETRVPSSSPARRRWWEVLLKTHWLR